MSARGTWAVALLWSTLTACETRCADGSAPQTRTWLSCDEVSRTCRERTEETCPCTSGPLCVPRIGCNGLSGVGEWLAGVPTVNPHVIDGAFGADEWTDTTRLEGLFTDVHLDYREGQLYFLNDWRANEEGIEPNCYNYFQLRVGTDWIDLRVYGNGEVHVRRNDMRVALDAEGAYGFGPSPANPTPHTIYEFRLPVVATEIDICCFDPLARSNCSELGREPMIVSVRTTRGGVEVRRSVIEGTVRRLAAGEPCGQGQGICEDGTSCSGRVGDRRCAPTARPDAGVPVDGGPQADGGPPV